MSEELTPLEALENIKQDYCKYRMCPQSVDACKMCDIGIIETTLKALEIIKTKIIDVQDVKIFRTYSSFNQRRNLRGLIGIEKEEYKLLKDILK